MDSLAVQLDEHIEEVAKALDETKQEIKESIPDLDKVLESIRGAEGPKGEIGERGERGESIIGPSGPRGEIGPRGERGERGGRGLDGKDGRNGETIIGPAGKDGVDGKDISNNEDIKNFKEELERLNRVIQNMPRGRSMGRAKVQITRRINLTSQVDGATSAFTLDPDVVDVLGVFSTQFPINFNAGTDWTFSGRTLTLDTARVGVPASGQTLWCLADVLFYP